MATINPDSIWILSALDKFMALHQNNSTLFCSLFDKKHLIIGLIQSAKLDAKKYKAILAKAYKEQSGEIKKCAQTELLKLKDANNQKILESWWRQIIEQTGLSFQEQDKKYKNIKKMENNQQPQAAQPQPVKKQNPSNNSNNIDMGFNLDEIISFKSLDSLLEENTKNKERYERILQKKQKLLGLVKSKAMTADKYKATLELYKNKTKNEDLISDYKFELEGINDFHEGNINSWFKQILQETEEKLQDQIKALSTNTKNTTKNDHKEIAQKPSRQSIKPNQQNNSSTSSQYNISEILSFKVFDEQLQILTNNKLRYKEVLLKKKQFITLSNNGGLNAEKYRALLMKAIKEVRNEEIKDSMEFQLAELTDFHEGNIQAWFKDVLSNSDLFLEDQQKILDQLEKGLKVERKSIGDDVLNMDDDDDDDDDQELVMDGDDFKIVKKQVKPTAKQTKAGVKKEPDVEGKSKNPKLKDNKHGINIDEIYSLKALDEYMSQFQKDGQMFCLFMQKKEQIFNLMKTGVLTPVKYKEMQLNAMKTTQNQKLKEVIEMDLFDLKDLCDNNVNEWFQNLVNESGDNYEDQQGLYNKMKGGKGVQAKPSQNQTVQVKQPEKFQKPNINELICISGIIQLFSYTVQKLDIIYYKQLVGKRQKLIDLIAQNRLNSVKYRQLNKATAGKTENVFLKNIIGEQQKRLMAQFKGKEDLWFAHLTDSLNKPAPQIKMPQNQEMKKLNKQPSGKKIEYLVKRASQYQSLLRYFQKHQVNFSANVHMLNYQKSSKKEILKTIELIKEDSAFDVYNFVEQLLPAINPKIFYGETVPMFKKKAEVVIDLLSKQIAAIKAYTYKLKKATNTENFEICKNEVGKCEQNMLYLKNWPGNQLAAFPIIKQQKTQKYNLDVNSHLEKNQVQIIISNIQGLKEEMMFKAFVADYANQRYFAKVSPKKVNSFKFIVKLPPKDMNQIYKGENKIILFRIYQIGFFGGFTLVGENRIEPLVRVNNIHQGFIQLQNIKVTFTLKVQKPSKPLTTEIPHVNIKIAANFKPDPQIQKQFISTYCSTK